MDSHDTKSADGLTRFSSGIEAVPAFPTTPVNATRLSRHGRTKTELLMVYGRDDRPWAGPDPPAAAFFNSPDREALRPASHLENFKGVLQVDGYPVCKALPANGDILLAACLAHAKRKFFEFHQATGSPITAAALRRIAELYAVERRVRGQPAKAPRQQVSQPLVDAMKIWLEALLGRVPPKDGLAEAIRCSLMCWSALCRFLDDGRIELDTNLVERAIRPGALGRKNHLFAGSDGGAERWATVGSLITPAKLNGTEPFAYLRDVLQRMVDGYPMSQLDDLQPWH